jgi:hypothetical protein
LIFSTGHYSSNVRKSARILCNSTGRVPRLSIQADVKKDMDSIDVYRIFPYKVDLDNDRPEDQKHPWQYEFTLKNVSEQPLSFSVVVAPLEYAEVNFPENVTVDPGGEKTFSVKFNDGIADDVFSKSFTIEANDDKHTRLTVPFGKDMRWGPAPTSQR